ncbi:MAG TPA: inositol monophosphatase family protein [Planctomycetota bacterium]|nr:inositol monophosphatase family protein [Planctomycetota bacterium]
MSPLQSPPQDPPLTALLDTAVLAARAAGDILKAHFEKTLSVDAASQHDLKLEVDRLSDAAIRQTLMDAFPSHSTLTEESGQTANTSPYTWIVDPLDGTVNYFHHVPYYCTSIACYRNSPPGTQLAQLGEPLVGVVFAPESDELYSVIRGQGAFRNGRRIETGREKSLSETLVCTTFGSSTEMKAQMQRVNSAMLARCRKIRCFGATALDLAWLSSGRLGGLYHPRIHTWDIAAGLMLIEEAGGKIELKPLGPQTWDLLTASAGIFDDLLAVVRAS